MKASLYAIAMLVGGAPALSLNAAKSAYDAQAAATLRDDARQIRANTAYLASDELTGREPGTAGFEKAAAHVAKRFGEIKLQPAIRDGGFYQPVMLNSRKTNGPGTMSVKGSGQRRALEFGTDFVDFIGFDTPGATISGKVVFAGRCIDDDILKINDFKGLDVRGKIVACIDNMHGISDNDVAAYLASAPVQRAMAARHGALGVLRIESEQARQRGYWRVLERARRTGAMSLAQRDRKAASNSLAWLSEEGAKKLFAGSAMAWADVAAGDRAGKVPVPGALGISVTITAPQVTDTPVASRNIVGMIKGSDPALRDEYVVMTAHLDHLGVSAADAGVDGDRINNGAVDNAAGVAMLIDAARRFAHAPVPPRRSVIFAALTAEETGFQGGEALLQQFAESHAGRIVANVNIDTAILSFPYTDMVAFGGGRSTIAAALRAAYAVQGIERTDDPWASEAIFTRSDHFSFVQQGIPAVMLQTGPGGAGKGQLEDYLAKRYHTPGDDMSQPILWDQAARFAELNFLIARTIANSDTAPRWAASDYFGQRFSANAETP